MYYGADNDMEQLKRINYQTVFVHIQASLQPGCDHDELALPSNERSRGLIGTDLHYNHRFAAADILVSTVVLLYRNSFGVRLLSNDFS